ncbi:MAG: hypothetical protein NT175_08040 [Bacteroidetes bacterium]|nr:hypothetical protein [Bacteroidota bacterium]
MTNFNIHQFRSYLLTRLQGILTQLDRDEDSCTFGCFDRNFWHYKIRDFSSMILQQGMLIPHTLYHLDFPGNPLYLHPYALKWVDGALIFWASQQLRSGAFNEYYPYESGYPPTAFSLYAVGLVARERQYNIENEQVKKAIQKAANWLMSHREVQAFNQEAAGLAGLFLCRGIPGIQIDLAKLRNRLDEFLNGQSPEGWFPEYGGTDAGYLSVTIDCLWDIYEITGDKKISLALEKAADYISKLISVSGHTPVMINARNTDYIVPYGLIRMAEKSPLTAKIVRTLFSQTSDPGHFLHRTDDRYTCHYVYQSCYRSLPYLEKMTEQSIQLPADKLFNQYLEQAGIWIRHYAGVKSMYVYAKKGGIVNVFDRKGIREVNFGWRARLGKGKVGVTHWLDAGYQVERSAEDKIIIRGRLSKHGWMKSSPLRHVILRVVSYLFGHRLMTWLRKAMIFSSPSIDVEFVRTVELKNDQVVIEDTFTGGGLKGLELYRAPHYSLRHVASAGNFVPEEMIVLSEDRIRLKPGVNEIKIKSEIEF